MVLEINQAPILITPHCKANTQRARVLELSEKASEKNRLSVSGYPVFRDTGIGGNARLQGSLQLLPLLRFLGSGLRVSGFYSLGLRGLWFGVQGLGVQGFRVQGFRVQGFRVQGFRVQGLGFSSSDFENFLSSYLQEETPPAHRIPSHQE